MHKTDEFTVEMENVLWRVHRDTAVVDGEWYRLRRTPETPPTLDTLPTPLPVPIRNFLLNGALRPGGLVLITGAPGTGKTTTASATVVSRLGEFGGIAYTVENPPEQRLNGWHGKGYCTQTFVSDERGWATSLKSALRSQPAGMPSILFVGEIREKDAAVVALQAAASGFLVIATAFGQSIPTSVENFLQMVTVDRANIFSSLLKGVVYMHRINDMIHSSALVIPAPTSPVAATIRSLRLNTLSDHVVAQTNIVLQGGDLWKESMR